jgi:hypothetical protein
MYGGKTKLYNRKQTSEIASCGAFILRQVVSVISCFFMTPTLVLYVYVYIYIDMYPYSSLSFYSLVIFFVLFPVGLSALRVIEVVLWSHHDVIIASLSFLSLCDLYFYIYSVVFPWIVGHFLCYIQALSLSRLFSCFSLLVSLYSSLISSIKNISHLPSHRVYYWHCYGKMISLTWDLSLFMLIRF